MNGFIGLRNHDDSWSARQILQSFQSSMHKVVAVTHFQKWWSCPHKLCYLLAIWGGGGWGGTDMGLGVGKSRKEEPRPETRSGALHILLIIIRVKLGCWKPIVSHATTPQKRHKMPELGTWYGYDLCFHIRPTNPPPAFNTSASNPV